MHITLHFYLNIQKKFSGEGLDRLAPTILWPLDPTALFG